MVPWLLAPTSAPAIAQRRRQLGEFAERVDLPGEVVHPDRPTTGVGRLGAVADREDPEIVVVVGCRGAEERGTGELGDDVEPE